MKYRNALIAAVTFGALGAGAFTVYLNDDEAASPAISTQAPGQGSGALIVAMNADEGVPQNLVTRTR